MNFVEENECLTGRNDCDVDAICRDLDIGYICECKPPYEDKSPNILKTGRVCVLDTSCPANNTCSLNALCESHGFGRYTVLIHIQYII